MKTSKLFPGVFVFALVFCLSFNFALARSGGEGEKLKAPDKTIGVAAIDNFVTGCFSFYETVYAARNGFALLQEQARTASPFEIEALFAKYKELESLIRTLMPKVDSLVNLSSSIPDHMKYVPILKYPRALKNIKLSVEAISFSVTQSKNLLFKDIPASIHFLSGKRSEAGSDSTKTTVM